MRKSVIPVILEVTLLLVLPVAGAVQSAAIIADHTVVSAFDQIPPAVVEHIKTTYNIFYGHTSHGSQIVTGMTMIHAENSIYDFNNGAGTLSISEYGDDLGTLGDTTWVPITRQALDEPGNDINMVIWSWCGGVSTNNEQGIDIYLNAINQLSAAYPNVTFIYMTGHLDGTGPTGELYRGNNQIRNYCSTNNKILFDFADIESFDPDGVYYSYETDACNWCTTWCASHSCPDCGDCAHSHCFNCYQKGKAFWWLLATIDGWNTTPDTCGDANSSGTVNALDVTFLINFLYKKGPAPSPLWKGDMNGNGVINALDVTYLINFLYKGGPDPICP